MEKESSGTRQKGILSEHNMSKETDDVLTKKKRQKRGMTYQNKVAKAKAAYLKGEEVRG